MTTALRIALVCSSLILPFGGCGGDDTTSSPSPISKDAAADQQADSTDDVSQDAMPQEAGPDAVPEAGADAQPDTTPDAPISPDAGLCLAIEGLCVPTSLDCTEQGGTPHPEGDPDCVFDDGNSLCCVAQAAKPTGESCSDRGGVCVPTPGACLKTNGAFGPPSADCSNYGPVALCCLPPSECSAEDLECCADTFTMRPYCDRGTWKCLDDSGAPVPVGTCG